MSSVPRRIGKETRQGTTSVPLTNRMHQGSGFQSDPNDDYVGLNRRMKQEPGMKGNAGDVKTLGSRMKQGG